jgi:molecular chaperone DnaJ
VVLTIKQHEFFTREGDNILYELPISFAEAALGAEVEVPTLDGETKLKIPSGSQTGAVFRLRGKGINHLNKNGRGDQLVTLFVVIPHKLNDKQRQLFQELAATLDSNNMPSSTKWQGWLDRFRTNFGV